MRVLPALVAKLTHAHDAWVVGSAANPHNPHPRDWDVQVPFSEWGRACMLIPADARPNTFGGFSCVSEGIDIDVWPGELGWIMQKPACQFAWHPASGTRIQRFSVEAPVKEKIS